MAAHDRQVVSSIFNIKHHVNLGKYLGYPVFKDRPKSETFSKIVNRTVENFQTWKSRHISKASKMALIHGNIESMLAHSMQCFQLRKETSRQIDKISRDFF